MVDQFLPNWRCELTPFGIENYLEIYSRYNGKLLYLYARGGKHGSRSYYGLGGDVRELFRRGIFSLDAKCELWKQPKMALRLHEEIPRGNLVGLLATATLNIQKNGFSFFQELGGKTEGFVPGQSLKKNVIYRLGLNLKY